MKQLYTDGVRDLDQYGGRQVSMSSLVLEDLTRACEQDRARAYEAGRLAEREAAFEARQEAYQGGWADAEARIIKLLEGLSYTDEDGHEMIGEFKTDLIALIKGEQG